VERSLRKREQGETKLEGKGKGIEGGLREGGKTEGKRGKQ